MESAKGKRVRGGTIDSMEKDMGEGRGDKHYKKPKSAIRKAWEKASSTRDARD